MKGNLRKDYNFSIIVTAEDLMSLSNMIMKDFEEIRFKIETTDGAQYKLHNLNDILEYTNPDSRKIKSLQIKGNKEKSESFYLPNICVSLFDTSLYDKSIILELNEMNEKEITYYTSRIDEFANKIKAPYWWIFKDRFYWISGIILYLAFGIIYSLNTNNAHAINKIYYILQLQGVFVACMAFSMFIFNKVVSLFYLDSCFALGEQEKHKRKKDKNRNIFFQTIVGTLVVGVLASLLAHFIIKLFAN